MQTVHSLHELRLALHEHRRAGRTVGFVPTMGALHEGHQTLFRRAAAECDLAVASLFVNPTQFNDPEDLAAYPRDPEGDSRAAREAGTGLLWMPSVHDLYPEGHATRVEVQGGITAGLCGATRPGHFAGVATVVTILLQAVQPDRAYFGQKDWQQLAVIRRLAQDLLLPGEIVGVPTVRDPDGLAMSSRNRRLTRGGRNHALAIPRALEATARAWDDGERSPDVLALALRAALQAPGLTVDYVEVVDPWTLLPPDPGAEALLALVAAWVDGVRLIDNRILGALPMP
jgi:pantoate--beta-alanine ligase